MSSFKEPPTISARRIYPPIRSGMFINFDDRGEAESIRSKPAMFPLVKAASRDWYSKQKIILLSYERSPCFQDREIGTCAFI